MNGLPVEIIEGIFKHISSLEDITNCFNTCVRWRQIIERLFREIYRDKYIFHNVKCVIGLVSKSLIQT